MQLKRCKEKGIDISNQTSDVVSTKFLIKLILLLLYVGCKGKMSSYLTQSK